MTITIIKDDDELEALLWTFWPDKERRREPELMVKKWWDHRSLHPVAATYHFADIYAEHVRTFIRAHINPADPRVTQDGRVIDWNPIKSGDVFKPPPNAHRTAYWQRKARGLIRARQAADDLGMPYATFIARACAYFWQGRGGYVLARNNAIYPEINLLYGDEVMTDIASYWLELLYSRMHLAEGEAWTVACDDGHPDRQAYRNWLGQQLALRANPSYAARTLVTKGHMTAEQVNSLLENIPALRKLVTS